MSNAERVESSYIEFEVQKADFKKVLSAHKRFAVSGKNVENSVLAWIVYLVLPFPLPYLPNKR